MERTERRARRGVAWLARLGLASVGVSFLLVAFLAMTLVVGTPGGDVDDRQDVLERVASSGWGAVLVTVIGLGFAGYAVWRLTLAFVGENVEDGDEKGVFARVGYLARGLFYSMLAVSVFRLVLTSSGGGAGEEKRTSTVLAWPGGKWLVGAAGIGFIVVGLANAYRAISKKYEKQLKTWEIPDSRRGMIRALAVAGLFARTVVFSIIGWFLLRAAALHDGKEAKGLDEAFGVLLRQPYGAALVAAVAVGLVAYGLFRMVEARYRTV